MYHQHHYAVLSVQLEMLTLMNLVQGECSFERRSVCRRVLCSITGVRCARAHARACVLAYFCVCVCVRARALVRVRVRVIVRACFCMGECNLQQCI